MKKLQDGNDWGIQYSRFHHTAFSSKPFSQLITYMAFQLYYQRTRNRISPYNI